jgi:hypothetical protein
VNKADSNVTTWPTASTITYGQTLASSTLSGGEATPAGSFAFTTPTTAPNAGTASQGVTFTPTDTDNYNPATGTASVIVNKAAQATLTTVATPSTVAYGSTSALSTTGGSGTGAVTYSTGSSTGCSVAVSTLSVIDARGTCNVTATKAADTNYNSTTSAALPVTLTKATPAITFGAAPTPTYLGGNFTVSASTTNTDSDALTYSYVSGPCAFVSGATFSSNGAGACVVQAAGVATTNFNAASQTQSVTIGKATPTMTITSDNPDPSLVGQAVVVNYTVTSTGGTPTGNVTVSDGAVDCTATVAAGTCSLTPTTAGTKTLTAAYAGDANFNTSSGTAAHQVNNPVPSITTLNPTSATAGGAAFTLTVNGANFVNGSTVQWNGANRTTTFVNNTQLTAAIPTGDIAAGVADITVFNHAPGGGTSNSWPFFVTQTGVGVTSVSSATGTNPTVTNTSANVSATTTGTGTVTVAQYASDPGGTPTFTATGQYFDVHISGTFTSVTIDICGLASGTTIYFWTGTAWVAASNQSYNAGCVTVTVNATTVPNLTQLAGAIFGVGHNAPIITEGASINVTMSEDGSTTPFSLTLHATDVDGDTITWSIHTQAGHGTASASGTGTSKAITYIPALNYIGSDSFVVQVSDGNGGTDTITVNVTITAVEPTSFTIFLPLILR